MNVNIVDTTLRDGEQKAGLALGIREKIQIAKLLDSIGIYQIEAGIPAMGGEEKKSIKRIVDLGLKSKISTWNRMNISDIKHSMDCGAEIIHISVPTSDIQIKAKFNGDRSLVVDNMRKCICYATEKGFTVTVGLEDASRADFEFLIYVVNMAFLEGAVRGRYADTVGVLHRGRMFEEIKKLKKDLVIDLEIHTHNDLGMAVSNSISAVRAGAEYVDCTIGGIGERAGNCSLLEFITTARLCLGIFKKIDIRMIRDAERDIMRIIKTFA